jgi:hypothetical protein
VSTEKELLALPRLYGAPAHTLRRTAAIPTEPAIGPDDLPIENYRSPEDQALALEMFPRAYTAHSIDTRPRPPRPMESSTHRPAQLLGKPLVLRALAGRLMRPKGN